MSWISGHWALYSCHDGWVTRDEESLVTTASVCQALVSGSLPAVRSGLACAVHQGLKQIV